MINVREYIDATETRSRWTFDDALDRRPHETDALRVGEYLAADPNHDDALASTTVSAATVSDTVSAAVEMASAGAFHIAHAEDSASDQQRG